MVVAKDAANPLTVEAGDVLAFDLLGTFSFAGIGVGAAAESEFVHLADHLLYAVESFNFTLGQDGKVGNLGTYEKHGGSVFASCYTSAATDAGSGIHCLFVLFLGDGNRVGVGYATSSGADVTASLDNLVESGAINHEVLDDGEWLGAPRLNPDFVAVVELAHVKLASGDAVIVAVWTTVDVKSAHTADAFATVVVEANGMGDFVGDKFFVEDVEHLKEGAFVGDVFYGIGLESALCLGVLLSPYM